MLVKCVGISSRVTFRQHFVHLSVEPSDRHPLLASDDVVDSPRVGIIELSSPALIWYDYSIQS